MTCCASVAPRPPCSGGQPRQVHPASARCRFQAIRSACASCSRPGPPASRSVAKRPVRLAASHSRIARRNGSSCGLERNPCLPATDPRARRGGCRPAGAPWLASNCPPRVGSAYQALASLEGTWVELTIPAMIASAAGKFGDGPALAEPWGPRISYHQLLQQTTTVARALIAEGVARGDRVAIWSPNTHHWVLAAFGALSAGAILVPVSTRFTGPEALDVITRSGASILIVADRFLGTDRFAALRTAAAAEAAGAGAGAENYTAERRPVAGQLPGQLRLVVRVPMPDAVRPAPSGDAEDGVIGWDELLDQAAAVPASTAEKRASAVDPG